LVGCTKKWSAAVLVIISTFSSCDLLRVYASDKNTGTLLLPFISREQCSPAVFAFFDMEAANPYATLKEIVGLQYTLDLFILIAGSLRRSSIHGPAHPGQVESTLIVSALIVAWLGFVALST
jgi:hypothetical protein